MFEVDEIDDVQEVAHLRNSVGESQIIAPGALMKDGKLNSITKHCFLQLIHHTGATIRGWGVEQVVHKS